uniref:Uncharacterized protein n=1 Tax=Salix viminalis TaxID=40686 RepID=A0A6N2KAT2_SALVM
MLLVPAGLEPAKSRPDLIVRGTLALPHGGKKVLRWLSLLKVQMKREPPALILLERAGCYHPSSHPFQNNFSIVIWVFCKSLWRLVSLSRLQSKDNMLLKSAREIRRNCEKATQLVTEAVVAGFDMKRKV